MNFNYQLFLAALGLACVLEALPWIICPRSMMESMRRMAELSNEQLRIAGIVLLIAGSLLCLLAKNL